MDLPAASNFINLIRGSSLNGERMQPTFTTAPLRPGWGSATHALAAKSTSSDPDAVAS